jgi:hypothetical protein
MATRPCLQNDRIDQLQPIVAPVADRAIDGPKLHAVGGEGLRQRLQFRIRAGTSPSQAGQSSSAGLTGMRSYSGTISSFGSVVMTVQLLIV